MNLRGESSIPYKRILGMRVDTTSYLHAQRLVLEWAEAEDSRYVCAANVHMIMEAYDASDFRDLVNSADLVVPDGMPVVWLLRRLGVRDQQRVCGPELMLRVCAAAARDKVRVGFYGGMPEVLDRLVTNLKNRFPGLSVAYAYSPPFRNLTIAEDEQIIEGINTSGARILFVGLGCPKQERWMAAHRGKIRAVMLGVGAAFDFHAGRVPQAPAWMQEMGLEWLFRLIVEPRRLWRRYLKHNPRFVVLAMAQLLGLSRFGEL